MKQQNNFRYLTYLFYFLRTANVFGITNRNKHNINKYGFISMVFQNTGQDDRCTFAYTGTNFYSIFPFKTEVSSNSAF